MRDANAREEATGLQSWSYHHVECKATLGKSIDLGNVAELTLYYNHLHYIKVYNTIIIITIFPLAVKNKFPDMGNKLNIFCLISMIFSST